MHSEAEESAERACTEDLRRKAEGAAGAVHAVRVGHEGERPPRLPISPLRAEKQRPLKQE